jgi:pimeloyl-ACP methyl ester carboxylesterase
LQAIAPLQALTTRVGGLPTRYLAAGDGPPVVLVHGVGESAFDWRGAMAHLSRARRVYAPDMPAVGGTGRPATGAATGDFSPAYHARFLGAFLDALGIERAAAVVGASLHGHCVLRFALSEPRRASAVGVVGGTGLGREVNPLTLPTVLPGWGELATGWAKTPSGAAQRAWGRVPLLFAHPSRVPEGWICEQVRLARLAGFLEAQLAAARSQFGPFGQRETVLDDLPGLPMPVLLVWGGRDRVLPVRHARDAAARLRKGRLEILPDCGHAAWLERPERFAGLLDGFLDEPERV